MGRQYAAHMREIRAKIETRAVEPAPSIKPDQNPDACEVDRASFGDDEFAPDGEEPRLHHPINDLSASGLRSYKEIRVNDNATSESREVYEGKTRLGTLSYGLKHGFVFYSKSVRPDLSVKKILSDVRELYGAHGWESDPVVSKQSIRLEEICTWVDEADAKKVITNLPFLFRYAETPCWAIEETSHRNKVLARNFRLPKLYPAGKTKRHSKVNLDVKFYRYREGTPFKLEFQIRLEKGNWVSESTWDTSIRATSLKLIDAFLAFCGVENSFVRSSQSAKVISLPRLEPDEEIQDALFRVKRRQLVLSANHFTRTLKHQYGFTDREVEHIKAFRYSERLWCAFAEKFYDVLNSGNPQELVRSANSLKLTKANFMYMDGLKARNVAYSHEVIDNFINHRRIVERREWGKSRDLLRLTDDVFELFILREIVPDFV